MTRTFIIKKMIRRLVELLCLAVIITVLTALLYTVMSILSHRVLIREALKSMPRPILLAWLAYLLFNQNVRDYDKKSREETKMIRDVESHFLERCPGKAISGHFRYGRKLTWYAWLRTDTEEEYRATEIKEEGCAFLAIHNAATGKLISSLSYPVSYKETGADKVRRVKEKLQELSGSPVYTIEYAGEDGRQRPLLPYILFETKDKDRYLAIEITADNLQVRLIYDLQTCSVIDSWTVETSTQ